LVLVTVPVTVALPPTLPVSVKPTGGGEVTVEDAVATRLSVALAVIGYAK